MKLKMLVGWFSLSCIGHVVQAQTPRTYSDQCPKYASVVGNPRSDGSFYFNLPNPDSAPASTTTSPYYNKDKIVYRNWEFRGCAACENDLNGDPGRYIAYNVKRGGPYPDVDGTLGGCSPKGNCSLVCMYPAFNSKGGYAYFAISYPTPPE